MTLPLDPLEIASGVVKGPAREGTVPFRSVARAPEAVRAQYLQGTVPLEAYGGLSPVPESYGHRQGFGS